MSPDVVILEEGAFAESSLYFEVLAPLTVVNNTVLLGISSPQSEDNYWSRLTNLKNNEGVPVFKNVNVKMACDACIAANKAADCIHKLSSLPYWKDAVKQKQLELIMSSDPDLYLRENFGLVTTDKIYYFSSKMVMDFLSNPRWESNAKIDKVYVSIDPSGGGSGSNFAICSTFHCAGEVVVMCFFLLFLEYIFLYTSMDKLLMRGKHQTITRRNSTSTHSTILDELDKHSPHR
jgi:hypothetical protein